MICHQSETLDTRNLSRTYTDTHPDPCIYNVCEVALISTLLWEDWFTFWMVYVSLSTWCIMNFHLCVFSFKNILWLFNIEHSEFVFMTEWKWYSNDQTLTLVPGQSRDESVVVRLLREIEQERERDQSAVGLRDSHKQSSLFCFCH